MCCLHHLGLLKLHALLSEQYCHLVFCFNFPSQTDVDDVYKCLEDQLLVIIRLSFLKAHQTQQTSYTLQI